MVERINSRTIILVLVIVLVLSTCTLSNQMLMHSVCTRSGNGVLESEESVIESMAAQKGQEMRGSFSADGSPLILGILHEDNYSESQSINSTQCVYFVFDIEDTLFVIVPQEGNWYLILRNPCVAVAHYEYTWSIRNTIDTAIELCCLISIPSSIIVIILLSILISRRKNIH